MKKLFVIAALFVSVADNAQFGVKGGLTLSTMNGADSPKDNKALMLYEAGGFAFQPALAYQVNGATLKQNNDVLSKTGFAEFSLGLQWGPDVDSFRPYLFVEPFVGYGITGKETLTTASGISADSINKPLQEKAKNKLEYGVGAGVGVEIASHFQLSAQLFRNFGTLYKESELDSGELTHIKQSYVGLKNYQGIKFTLAFLF